MTQFSEPSGRTADPTVLSGLIETVGRTRCRDSFRRLFDHFAPRVRAFLIGRRVPPAQADDLTQDVMLTIWRRAESFDGSKAAASTWVFTIARNAHIDQFRKAERARKLDDKDPVFQPPETPLADTLYERSEDVDAVASALGELPEDQRGVLDLAFGEGWSHREIADRLNLPLGTVKSRIRLAMDKLRMSLGEWE